MEDLQGFPRFQWSLFPHGKEGEQVVVRGNSFEQFILDIEEVKRQFMGVGEAKVVVPAQEPVETSSVRVCPNCGSSMEHKGGEKNGKAWGGWFCTNRCGATPVWDKV